MDEETKRTLNRINLCIELGWTPEQYDNQSMKDILQFSKFIEQRKLKQAELE